MYKHILLIITLFTASFVCAEKDYNSGFLKIDQNLKKIHKHAVKDLKAFKKELSKEFKLSETELDRLFDLRMDPAEVYLCLEVMKITASPMAVMIDVYENDHHKGWEFMINEMGIGSESTEVTELRDAVRMKAHL